VSALALFAKFDLGNATEIFRFYNVRITTILFAFVVAVVARRHLAIFVPIFFGKCATANFESE